MLDRSDACVLVTHSKYLDRVEPILVNTPKIEFMVVLETLGKGIPKIAKPILDWAQLIDNDGGYIPEEVLWV